mgnify:CR=1 FL=1
MAGVVGGGADVPSEEGGADSGDAAAATGAVGVTSGCFSASASARSSTFCMMDSARSQKNMALSMWFNLAFTRASSTAGAQSSTPTNCTSTSHQNQRQQRQADLAWKSSHTPCCEPSPTNPPSPPPPRRKRKRATRRATYAFRLLRHGDTDGASTTAHIHKRRIWGVRQLG